jgi:hypothetical protein
LTSYLQSIKSSTRKRSQFAKICRYRFLSFIALLLHQHHSVDSNFINDSKGETAVTSKPDDILPLDIAREGTSTIVTGRPSMRIQYPTSGSFSSLESKILQKQQSDVLFHGPR